MGFVDPMSLADGILGWADAGHPVVAPASAASHASAASAAAVVMAANCG
jgi:hypothetical protein